MPDTLNTRWAYTALAYANSQNAVPDEIMIDKKLVRFGISVPTARSYLLFQRQATLV